MIPMEMLSVIGGSATGFLFRYITEKRQDEKDKFDRMMSAIDKTDQSMNSAAERHNDKNGHITRRIIILFILFGCILMPAVLAILGKTTTVEVLTPVRTFLGLFEWGGNTRFYQIPSYLLSKELMSGLMLILSFSFGQAAGKSK